MTDDFNLQVYSNLNLKETDELVDIWQTNDHVEWSDVAFGAVRKILLGRLGELPPQGEPIYKHEEDNILDEEDEESIPVFYNPWDVISLAKWLRWAAVGIILITIISAILKFSVTMSEVYTSLTPFFTNPGFTSIIAYFVTPFVVLFEVIIQCMVVYLALTSLASMLKILMEIEFNSRGIQ